MIAFDLEKAVAARRLCESDELPEGYPEWAKQLSALSEASVEKNPLLGEFVDGDDDEKGDTLCDEGCVEVVCGGKIPWVK